MMHIWVDADACPKVIKDILFAAAIRTRTKLTLVSNHAVSAPASPYIDKKQVEKGFDVADNRILEMLAEHDLVVTADIPLAAAVIERNAIALNPRGELYTEKNIKQRLSIRNFSEGLRSSGVLTGGPASISKKEIHQFAAALDKLLT